MSIRTKILLACFCMAAVTLAFGGAMWRAQNTLSEIGVRLYDDAFVSMNRLRAAQHSVLLISRQVAGSDSNSEVISELLDEALADIGVAEEKALSERGRDAASQLNDELSRIWGAYRTARHLPDHAILVQLEKQFDHAVELNAGDGFRSRRSADRVIAHTASQTWMAIGAALVMACVISIVLTRAIVPPLAHAVGIAVSVAGGRLDNRIEIRGRGETSQLLKALLGMQQSISERMERIKRLMADQTSRYADEVASEREKLETALENMVQGLCMFDGSGRIVTVNRRFGDMFGPARIGDDICTIVPEPLRWSPAELDPQRKQTCRATRALDDGRIVTVLQRPMDLGGWVATYEDVTEQHRAEERIAHLARHDPLTGLPNRMAYRERVGELFAQASPDAVLAVLCLGLDRFGSINDTFGHKTGDEVLCVVADRLQHAIRGGDCVARIYGDEFAIVSILKHHAEVRLLGERLLRILREPFRIGAYRLDISASIGIALGSSEKGGADLALKHAELALQKAKSAGGGDLRFFEAEMDAEVVARRRMQVDLKSALTRGELRNVYQPILDLRRGCVKGGEAVVQWLHPEQGLIQSAAFMPVAQESGLSSDIGFGMLERACLDAMHWSNDVTVLVRLWPSQFRKAALVQEVARTLDRTGLPPSRLELAIDESMILPECPASIARVQQLRDLGVATTLDGFGTGHSSLGVLHKFAFSRIRIEGSFVEDAVDTKEGLAIIRAVLYFGKTLGLSIDAASVDNERQLSLLAREGCDCVQGAIVGTFTDRDNVTEAFKQCERRAQELLEHIEHAAA